MNGEKPRTGDQISASITGPVQGQVAVGKGISQDQQVGSMAIHVTDTELVELRQAFADLKAQVAASAPPGSEGAALERVGELEEALTAEKPDLTTVQYVKQWFVKNLPGLAGSITGILIHPVVGKLVEAAGDAVAERFREVVEGSA